MPGRGRSRAMLLVAVAALAALLCVASASAATRFAGPGGTGSDPCANPERPCSIFTAADNNAPGSTLREGDEVVLAPGEYSDSAGDLGPESRVVLGFGVRLHGEPGQARPVIALEDDSRFGGIIVLEDAVVSDLEIETATAAIDIVIFGGFVQRLLARSSTAGAETIVCAHFGGVLRDSACLSSGAGATAVGSALVSGGGNENLTLRNVTAIASGRDSFGIDYELSETGGDARFRVDAKSVLARGTAADVAAHGLSQLPHQPGTGAEVEIALDHSDYVTTSAVTDAGGGVATVTAPGSGTNITAPPHLAADGFHQLPGSPTQNAGAADLFTGVVDIDGDQRQIGLAADIGADELTGPDPVPAPPAPMRPGAPAQPGMGGGPVSRDLPGTALGAKPRKAGRARLARFTFSSSQDGARFECRLDAKPFKPCRSPFKAKVSPGQHTFRVRAVSAAGTPDPSPAVFGWKVLAR